MQLIAITTLAHIVIRSVWANSKSQIVHTQLTSEFTEELTQVCVLLTVCGHNVDESDNVVTHRRSGLGLKNGPGLWIADQPTTVYYYYYYFIFCIMPWPFGKYPDTQCLTTTNEFALKWNGSLQYHVVLHTAQVMRLICHMSHKLISRLNTHCVWISSSCFFPVSYPQDSFYSSGYHQLAPLTFI